MDMACVEMKQPDGTVIAIDTLAVEREFVETWLIAGSPYFHLYFLPNKGREVKNMRRYSQKSKDYRVSVELPPFGRPERDAHCMSILNTGKGVD